MRRLLLALAGLPLLAATLPPEEAKITAERMAAFPMARGVEAVEAYSPAETIRGVRAKDFATDPGAISAEALDKAEAYAARQNSYAFIVAKDGKIVRERYWLGYGPASRYSTASMHKSVMSLAYGPAIAAGKIALDDPVGKYLPEWKDDPRGRITIRQLLQMASGLQPPPAPPGPGATGTQLMFAPDIRKVALDVPAGPDAPGSVFLYGNHNSELAGMALTKAVGGRYADWLSAKLWKPIGASDAAIWLDHERGTPHFFCCIQVTARDWLRVGELVRNHGKVGGRQVIPASYIDAATAPSPANPNYGLQLWRGSPHLAVRGYGKGVPLTVPAAQPFAADDVIFLDGAGAQRVYAIPSAGLTIVRIGKPSTSWDDSAMPNMLLTGLKR